MHFINERTDPELTKTILIVMTFSLNRYKYSVEQFDEYPAIRDFVLSEAQSGWLQEYSEELLSITIEEDFSVGCRDEQTHETCLMGVEDLKQFVVIFETLYANFKGKMDSQGADLDRKAKEEGIKAKILAKHESILAHEDLNFLHAMSQMRFVINALKLPSFQPAENLTHLLFTRPWNFNFIFTKDITNEEKQFIEDQVTESFFPKQTDSEMVEVEGSDDEGDDSDSKLRVKKSLVSSIYKNL